MNARVIGAVCFGALGFFAGAGTGIVGGLFGAVAGVSVFTTIGVLYGISAGPDIASAAARWRRSKQHTSKE